MQICINKYAFLEYLFNKINFYFDIIFQFFLKKYEIAEKFNV